MMKKRVFQLVFMIMLTTLPVSLLIQNYYTKDYYARHRTIKVTKYLKNLEETKGELINDEGSRGHIVSTLFLKFRMIPALVVTKDNQI